MKLNTSRVLPVTAAIALLLSACGSDGDDGRQVAAPVTTVAPADGGMRAPTPISVSSDFDTTAGPVADASASSAEMATDRMIAPMYIVGEFVVGDGFPALPTDSTGYVFDAGVTSTADQAARLAAVLGVAGDPVAADDGYNAFRVGPDDGSAPSVWLASDPQQSWYYNAAWEDRPAVECVYPPETVMVPSPGAEGGETGSAAVEPSATPATVDAATSGPAIVEPTPDDVAPDTPVETLVPISEPAIPLPECEEPTPPEGVPTQAEAEQRTRDMLAALGVDASNLQFDSYADDWSASVSANQIVTGAYIRSWNFGFGAGGALQWAGGSLATPEPVGPYQLVDLDTAVARLNDSRYGQGWPSARGGIEPLATESAPATDGGDVDDSVSVDVAEAPVETLPVAPEPEEITVTLTGVTAGLWWVWDTDGSVWLVPAYEFTGDDGGTYTVPAVTDDYLVETDAPIPVEPDGGTGGGSTVPDTTTPPTPDTTAPPTPVSDSPVAEYVGLPVPEFEQAVTEAGYGPVRVVELDGEPLAVTMDLMDGRVDVKIETRDGVEYVVDATVEQLDPTPTGDVVPISAVYDGVGFYPACGNEILDHESGTWYQVRPEEYPDLWEKATGTAREPAPGSASPQGFARVAPPEAGDDIGTLTVWDDGVASFTSDSGRLQTWLVLDELQYGWEC